MLSYEDIRYMLNAGNYPENERLTDAEITDMIRQHDAAMCSTDGDQGKIELTARQLGILMGCAVNRNGLLKLIVREETRSV